MKKILFALTALLIVGGLSAFTWTTNVSYDHLLNPEQQKEFLTATNSSELITNVADVFSHNFDQVARIDIHRNSEEGYYYAAFGKKMGIPVYLLIQTSEEMAQNQLFPSRQDLGIRPEELVIDCYCGAWGVCSHAFQGGKVCGVATDRMMDCTPVNNVVCPIVIPPLPWPFPKPKPIDGDRGNN